MACINPNSPEFKEILSKVNNPLLAEIEMDKSITVDDTSLIDSAYREDANYIRITMSNKSKYSEVLAKFNIKQVKSHFYYVLSKQQQTGTTRWLKLASRNKNPLKQLLGSTKKGYELESRDKGTQDWQKGEVTIKVIKGKTYLAIEDQDKILETDTDGYKWFRYPVKDFYLIPIEIIGNDEEKAYLKADKNQKLFIPFIQKEINKMLIKTENISAKKSANYYLLQVKSLIKDSFEKIQNKQMSYEDLRDLSTGDAEKLYKELGIEDQIAVIKTKFKEYVNSLKKEELVKEILDLYNAHLKDNKNELNYFKEYLNSDSMYDYYMTKDDPIEEFLSDAIHSHITTAYDIDDKAEWTEEIFDAYDAKRAKLLEDIFKNENKDLKDLEKVLNYLPEDFLKLITFKYVNYETAYFSTQSEKNITEFDELRKLADVYDMQVGMAINVAIRNMKRDGVITDEEVEEINSILTENIKKYLELKKKTPLLADCLKNRIIKKVKTILSLSLEVRKNFLDYWEKAQIEIRDEANSQNKGLSYLSSMVYSNLKDINTVFSEVVLGEINGEKLNFAYDKVTVALHELGHALDKYLLVSNKPDRDKIISFIDELKKTNEFKDYLINGLNSRGYRNSENKEITADLYAYLIGKAVNKNFQDSHLKSLDDFFNNNIELTERLFVEIFGRTYKKVEGNTSIISVENSSIVFKMKELLNNLIKVVNKIIGKDYFRYIDNDNKYISVVIENNNISLVTLFDKLRDIIMNRDNFNIDTILDSSLNEMDFAMESIKSGIQSSKQDYKTNEEAIAKIESNRNNELQELIRSNSSVYNKYVILADNDYIKAKLKDLDYTEKVKKLVEMGVLASFDQTGAITNNPNDISLGWTTDRPIVMVRFGDEVVPFYRSSKGNSGKESGRWYNFFGFGDDGWLIKADIATIKRYYDNPFWKKIGDLLTDVLDYDHELDIKKGRLQDFHPLFMNNELALSDTNVNYIVHGVDEYLPYDHKSNPFDIRESLNKSMEEWSRFVRDNNIRQKITDYKTAEAAINSKYDRELENTKQDVEDLFEKDTKLANAVYEALGFTESISLESNLKNTGKTEQELIEYLKKKYPEIKLNITDSPQWEQDDNVFNQSIEDEINTFELFEDQDKLCPNGICNYTAKKSTKHLEKIGLNPYPSNYNGSQLPVKVKSPIGDFNIEHYVSAVAINNVIYIYDMPQNEFISNEFFGKDSDVKVKESYKPRLIPLTIDEIKANYNLSTKEAGNFIHSIISNKGWEGADAAPSFKTYIENNIKNPQEYINLLETQIKDSGYEFKQWDVEEYRREVKDKRNILKTKKVTKEEEQKVIKYYENKLKLKTKEYLPKRADKFSLKTLVDSVIGRGFDSSIDFSSFENALQSLDNYLKSENFIEDLLIKTQSAEENLNSVNKSIEQVYALSKLFASFTKQVKVYGIEEALKKYDSKQQYTIRTLLPSNVLDKYKSKEQAALLLQKYWGNKDNIVKQLNIYKTKTFTDLITNKFKAHSVFNKYQTVLNFLKSTDFDSSYLYQVISNEAIRKYTYFDKIGNTQFQKDEFNRIIGQANIKAMTVLVDAVNKKQDTIPHEYAHHYIAWFRDTPIVQEGIKRFGSEEALVQAIGEQVIKQKGEAYNWWKKFTNFIISLLSDKQLLQILTDSFLNRTDLNTDFTYNAITPQQKQKAQQLYSQYLSNFVNTNFDSIISDLQSKNLLEKKCS